MIGLPLSFNTNDGVYWTVREYAVDAAMGNDAPTCLVFTSDTTMRRVRAFPAHWRELGADALLELSWGH